MLLRLCPFPKQSLFCIVFEGGQLERLFYSIYCFFIRHHIHIFSTKTILFYFSLVVQSNYGRTKNTNNTRGYFLSQDKPEWPLLPGASSETLTPASTIPPAPKVPSIPVSWSTQANKKTPQDYKNDRVEKYAQYFKGNRILPIPELVEAVQPKTLSLIVSDIKTRRLAGLKKRKV